MSDTIYLVFPDQETAVTALQSAGYGLSEYQDHIAGNGWGTVLAGSNGIECNIYDANALDESLVQYQIPPPATPNNIRAGDSI